MSLLDNDFEIDSAAISNRILKYIDSIPKYHNLSKNWKVIIYNNVNYINDPGSWYLYYFGDYIYIYSVNDMRLGMVYAIYDRGYKHVNLKKVLEYESA